MHTQENVTFLVKILLFSSGHSSTRACIWLVDEASQRSCLVTCSSTFEYKRIYALPERLSYPEALRQSHKFLGRINMNRVSLRLCLSITAVVHHRDKSRSTFTIQVAKVLRVEAAYLNMTYAAQQLWLCYIPFMAEQYRSSLD